MTGRATLAVFRMPVTSKWKFLPPGSESNAIFVRRPGCNDGAPGVAPASVCAASCVANAEGNVTPPPVNCCCVSIPKPHPKCLFGRRITCSELGREYRSEEHTSELQSHVNLVC